MSSLMLGTPIPILLSFDDRKMHEFYVEFLGFAIDWTHRFEAALPLYIQISRAECRLHLSEHHGDACPGSALRIPVDDVAAYYAEISAKGYRFARPGIVIPPWGGREFSVQDPFGNRLTFFAPSNVDVS